MSEHSSLPQRRKDALELGSTTFFNGKPCPRGHVATRYARNSGCTQCAYEDAFTESAKTRRKRNVKEGKAKVWSANWRAKNPDKVRQYLENNREKKRAYDKKYNIDNAEKKRKAAQMWRKENPDKEREKQRFIQANRRANKKKATPSWANLEEIRKIYSNCPPGMHVDHILPLQGREVCGLHVAENLQYLTEIGNKQKGAGIIQPFQGELLTDPLLHIPCDKQ